MDNFMDKIAQKLSSQEIIKANAQAEAVQMKQLQQQFAVYDECIKEMRTLNNKNTELADRIKVLIEEYHAKMQEAQESTEQEETAVQEAIAVQEVIAVQEMIAQQEQARQQLIEEIRQAMEEVRQTIEENSGKVDGLSEKTEEFVHKENVKVYRNVQAVVTEEIKNQSDELLKHSAKIDKRLAGVKPMVLIALVLSAANAVMLVLQILRMFGMI